MPLLLILFGGWPLAAYFYFRFHCHRRPAAAFWAATLVLLLSFYVGITIGDLLAVLSRRQPTSPQRVLFTALGIIWYVGPYLGVAIWWIRRLLRPRRGLQNT